MFRSYFTTGWRHIANSRLFSLINVFGLATGLMSCILILMFVRDEMSYDQWLPDGDALVRMHTAYLSDQRPPFRTVRSAGRMMEAIRDFAPTQVAAGVRLVMFDTTLRHDDRMFNERIVFADSSFFDVFALPFVHGASQTAFVSPGQLLVSESMAVKYFGRTDVIGETLTGCCLDDVSLELPISGVLRDLPENSHLDFDFLVVMDPVLFEFAPHLLYTWTSLYTYT
jgi:putative ABC transport system permease protein